MTQKESSPDFVALLDFLKRNRGFDFTGYKQASLERRIAKRMQMVNVNSYEEYVDYLEVHPNEFTQLFNTILINVTSFFRDPAAWDFLAKEIVPGIVKYKGTEQVIRAWSTGCASGEEAYSLAMVLAEAVGPDQFLHRVKIYATDVDEEALNKARQAVYSEKEVEGIPPDLLSKYFVRSGNTYSFSKDLRRGLVFGRNDLIQDAPISRIDLLICRNTLMYFNAEAQTKILSRLNFSLTDRGVLFLGRAEMLLTHTNLFTPIDLKLRIFRKVPRPEKRERVSIMSENGEGEEETADETRQMKYLRDSVFDTTPLPLIVLDANNKLIFADEEARSIFGLTYKDIDHSFHDLLLSYHPVELRSVIRRVYAELTPLILTNVEWPLSEGEKLFFDIHVTPLRSYGNGIAGVSIAFIDVSQHNILQKQLEETNHELETAFEELQSTNEELETTNEELQSTVEELETTNEEFQSTNEELETMNEELQVTNEELQNINDELRQRTIELNRVSALNESLLANIQSGAIMLDKDMNIQVWNRKAEDLWGLRSEETLGENFFNLDIGLPVEQLRKAVQESLDGNCDIDEVYLEAHDRRGRPFQCKITVTPVINHNKLIEGVIALMEDSNSRA